jgi:hypothetical protein
MKKISSALFFVIASISVSLPMSQAHAAKFSSTTKKTIPQTSKKSSAAPDEERDEPDVQAASPLDYSCELGNKIAIYTNANDDQHIALRWKKRIHRLTRVVTSTGANRFENKLYALVWIDIPSKGMLLDSKKGQQLANECRTPEQITKGT